jgi:hypothetical protein
MRTAMRAAQERDALGVVAGVQRTGVLAPPLLLLPAAALVAVLGVLPRRLPYDDRRRA